MQAPFVFRRAYHGVTVASRYMYAIAVALSSLASSIREIGSSSVSPVGIRALLLLLLLLLPMIPLLPMIWNLAKLPYLISSSSNNNKARIPTGDTVECAISRSPDANDDSATTVACMYHDATATPWHARTENESRLHSRSCRTVDRPIEMLQ